jgi:hypothetical protein
MDFYIGDAPAASLMINEPIGAGRLRLFLKSRDRQNLIRFLSRGRKTAER